MPIGVDTPIEKRARSGVIGTLIAFTVIGGAVLAFFIIAAVRGLWPAWFGVAAIVLILGASLRRCFRALRRS